jgi:hypothetical protein
LRETGRRSAWHRSRGLTVVMLARKLMTTKAHLREMTEHASRKAKT